jgi:hypothetical protein
MQVSQGVSRQQEFAADLLAARTVGAKPMIEGLRKLATGSIAFAAYWRQEFVPLLDAGFQPPLAEGFARFLAEPKIMKEVESAAQALLAQKKADPYDSHPPDAERIAALSALPQGPEAGDEPAAITLIDGLDLIDPAILIGMSSNPPLRPQRIAWADAGTVALVPGCRERVRRQAAVVGNYTVGWLPELLKYADRLGNSEAKAVGATVTPEQARSLGIELAGAALLTALAQNGWTAESLPGRPVVMRRGEVAIEPFVDVRRLARGEVDVDTWQRRCWDLGVRDLGLAPV